MHQEKVVSTRKKSRGESSSSEWACKQTGQAYVEYIVAAVLVIGALWAPVFNGESAISIYRDLYEKICCHNNAGSSGSFGCISWMAGL